MDDRLQGFVFGVRTAEVTMTLRNHRVIARVRGFSPLASLAFGLSRKRLLEARSLPTPPVRRSVLALMALWAAFGVGFLFTMSAFYLAWSNAAQLAGVAASLALGTLAIVGTAIAVHQVGKEGPDATLTGPDDAPWGYLMPNALTGTEFDLFLIGFLLFLIIVLFVLYVVWLPLLVLILSILTLGQLWREFQGTLVAADRPDVRQIGRAAEELLHDGAVLTKSWDPYLGDSSAQRAAELRSRHSLSYRLLVAVGVSSLAAAGLALLSREVFSDLWMFPITVAIAATVSLLIALLVAYRNRIASASGP